MYINNLIVAVAASIFTTTITCDPAVYHNDVHIGNAHDNTYPDIPTPDPWETTPISIYPTTYPWPTTTHYPFDTTTTKTTTTTDNPFPDGCPDGWLNGGEGLGCFYFQIDPEKVI